MIGVYQKLVSIGIDLGRTIDVLMIAGAVSMSTRKHVSTWLKLLCNTPPLRPFQQAHGSIFGHGGAETGFGCQWVQVASRTSPILEEMHISRVRDSHLVFLAWTSSEYRSFHDSRCSLMEQ